MSPVGMRSKGNRDGRELSASGSPIYLASSIITFEPPAACKFRSAWMLVGTKPLVTESLDNAVAAVQEVNPQKTKELQFIIRLNIMPTCLLYDA